MKIALDAFGGDFAPSEIVKGAVLAANQNTFIYLVGDETKLKKELSSYEANPYIEIVHASQNISMEEEPAKAVRQKRDSSIVVAAKLVGDKKADALVSAGSTGAQLAASIFYIGRIKGVKRPAICINYPTRKGMKLITDAGANPMANAEQIEQFAVMGSIYAKKVLHVDNPSVALINNGTEDKKGTDTTKEAFERMKTNENLNFIGNIEGKDIPLGEVDVMVCDGFTGNIVLKLSEGLSKTLFSLIKESLLSKWYRKIGAMLIKGGLVNIKKSLDSTEYGGAPLLGVDGVSIICHGSSNAKAIVSAINATHAAVEAGYVDEMKEQFKN
ncbi:phosphate acyltransferase PlsX [Clostridia bacterium]|nr:phosphate acyltransferase PlsX [Clostridia bacterium]